MFANFIISLLSVIGSGLTGAFKLFGNFLKTGSQQMVKFQKEGISYARSMGMSLKEAQAYTNTLIERTEVLAQKYGVTAEQIAAVQRNLSEATGRQLMLNNQEAEWAVQINKLVGEQTAKAFTAEIMNHMGGQLSTAQGAVSKAYATAAKRGLDAANFSAKVAQNLSLANKLSFRNGVDGITRMTALSEKLGFNLQSIASAADKFLELDASIENAAQLQMLGGSAAVYGGNPLTMAYEANYDPEAFTERMTNMLKGYATFNRSTGMGEVNGMNRDFVKNIANAMGIGMEEAMTIAKKQAELGYKEGAVGGKLWNLSESQRDFIMNKSYVDAKTGHVMVNGENGPIDVSKDGITRELVESMQKFDRMSEKDLMETQASKLTDINEKMKGIEERISAIFAEKIQKFLNGTLMPNMDKFGNLLANIAKPMSEILPPILDALGNVVNTVLPPVADFFKQHGNAIAEFMKNIGEKMGAVITWMTKWPKTALAILGTWWITKKALGGVSFGRSATTAGARAGKSVFGGFKKFGSWMHKGSPHSFFKSEYRVGRDVLGYGKTKSFFSAMNSARKMTPLTTKLTGAAGLGISAFQAIGAQTEYNREKERILNSDMSEAEKKKALDKIRVDKNSEIGGAVGSGVGTVLGTFFFGPLGGIIGGAVGQFAGQFIGKYWDPIVDTAKKALNGILSGLKFIWDGALNFGKWIVDHNPIDMLIKSIGKIFGKDWSLKGSIKSVLGWFGEKRTNGGIVGEGAKSLITNNEVYSNSSIIEKHTNGGLVGNTSNSVITNNFSKEIFNNDSVIEKHDIGGIVGGSSTQGDKIITGLNSGEMVLNKEHQLSLFNFINGLPSLLSKVGATNNVTYYSAASNNSALANVQGNRTFNTNDQATNTIVNTMNSTLSRLWASNDTSSYSTIADNAVSTRNYLSSIDNSLKSINNSTATSNFVNRAITSNPSTNANYFSSNAVNSYATNNSSNANYNTSTVSNSSSSVVGNSVRRVANNSVNDNVTYYVANNPSNTSNLFTRVNGDTTLFNSTYNASTLANRVLSSLQNTAINGYSTNNTLTNANTTSNTSNVFTRVVNDILSMFLGNVTNNGVTSNGGTSIRNVAVSNEYSDVARVLNSSLSSVDNGISVLTKYSNLSSNTVNTNNFANTLTSILSTLYGGNTNNVNSATIGVSNYGGMSSSSILSNETVGGITNSPTFVNALSSVLSNITNSTSNIRNNSLTSILSSVLSNFTNSTSNIRNNSLASVLNTILSNVYGGNSNVSNNSLNSVNGRNVITSDNISNTERNYTVSQAYNSNQSNGSYVTSNVSTNNSIVNGITNILSDLGSVTSNVANASSSVSEFISNLSANSNVLTNIDGTINNTFASVLNNALTSLYGGNVNISNGQTNTLNGGNVISSSLANTISNSNTNSSVFSNVLMNALSNLYGLDMNISNNEQSTVNGVNSAFSNVNSNVENTSSVRSNTLSNVFGSVLSTLVNNVSNEKNSLTNVLNSVLSSLYGGNTSVSNKSLSTVNGVNKSLHGIYSTNNDVANTLITNNKVIDNVSKDGGIVVVGGKQVEHTSNIMSSNMLNTALSTMYNSSSNVITNALNTKNDVVTKPVGEKEYIYIPKSNGGSSNETTVEVKDININLNGTIRLEGGRSSRDVDANMLLNDIMFISSLKDLIKEAINNDMHGGRFMNDLATRRGSSQSSTLFGS